MINIKELSENQITVIIIGRFCFRQTFSNNLIGEFSNQKSEANFTESANFISQLGDNNVFEGEYFTSWLENQIPIFSKLKIFPKDNTRNIYKLIWVDSKGNEIFHGEGFVHDSLLIGDYRNFVLE
jgi:hypothetical protein